METPLNAPPTLWRIPLAESRHFLQHRDALEAVLTTADDQNNNLNNGAATKQHGGNNGGTNGDGNGDAATNNGAATKQHNNNNKNNNNNNNTAAGRPSIDDTQPLPPPPTLTPAEVRSHLLKPTQRRSAYARFTKTQLHNHLEALLPGDAPSVDALATLPQPPSSFSDSQSFTDKSIMPHAFHCALCRDRLGVGEVGHDGALSSPIARMHRVYAALVAERRYERSGDDDICGGVLAELEARPFLDDDNDDDDDEDKENASLRFGHRCIAPKKTSATTSPSATHGALASVLSARMFACTALSGAATKPTMHLASTTTTTTQTSHVALSRDQLIALRLLLAPCCVYAHLDHALTQAALSADGDAWCVQRHWPRLLAAIIDAHRALPPPMPLLSSPSARFTNRAAAAAAAAIARPPFARFIYRAWPRQRRRAGSDVDNNNVNAATDFAVGTLLCAPTLMLFTSSRAVAEWQLGAHGDYNSEGGGVLLRVRTTPAADDDEGRGKRNDDGGGGLRSLAPVSSPDNGITHAYDVPLFDTTKTTTTAAAAAAAAASKAALSTRSLDSEVRSINSDASVWLARPFRMYAVTNVNTTYVSGTIEPGTHHSSSSPASSPSPLRASIRARVQAPPLLVVDVGRWCERSCDVQCLFSALCAQHANLTNNVHIYT
jgi:hypothetical protein